MGIGKAVVIGLLGAVGIATVAHELEGRLGELVRMHNLYLPIGGFHLYFSGPVFILITLFAWAFFFWSRD